MAAIAVSFEPVIVAGKLNTQLVTCGNAADGVIVKIVLLVDALVTVLLVPLGHSTVIPLVTDVVSMAVEKVAVNGAAVAPEIPVVPVVAMVALDPSLVAVPVMDETVGVSATIVNVNVAAEAIATLPALFTPVVVVNIHVAPSAMALDGVMVAPTLPTMATVDVWLVESQLSVSVLVVSVDVSMAVEKMIENAASMGTSVVPVVPMAVPLVVVNDAMIGAADGPGAGLLTVVPH